MGRIVQLGLAVLLTLVFFTGAASAQSRNALVIGNSAYVSAPKLKTPATDAAIVAETLRAAGYDVTELHDLRQETIGQSLRDFLDKVAGGGPDGAAIVYYSGHGAQSEGENYLIPVDAVINNDADVANEAFRLNDLLDELAKIPLAARIVVLDASRDHKFGAGGDKPVPKGLAMGDTIPGTLLAYAAAPGALADDGDGDYSLYTGALVTLMRQPGLDIEQIFKAVRLEVNKTTNGSQTPWMVADLAAEVRLFAATAAAPAPQATASGARIPPKEERTVTKEMLRGLSPDDAYAVAVEEDTLETYQWFVELYSKHALAPQVWDIIETRREAVLWQRTLAQNTTRAYWNYLKRYPKGAHVAEAQDQLAALSAPPAPPPNYVVVPEALPPDYYDEAVGIYEVYPEGYDAQPSVFGLLAPLFLPSPPPRQHFDRGRSFIPNRIPGLRGDPVGAFTRRDRSTRDRTATGTGTGRNRNQTGIVRNTGRTTTTPTSTTTTRTPTTNTGRRIDQGSIVGNAGRPITNRKPGLTIRPTGTPTTGRPTTPTTPGSVTGRPTTPTTPGVTTTGPTTPGSTTGRPTTGRPTLPPSGRPTIPGSTTGRPTTPGVTTGRPTTPGVTTTGRPTLPPRPGTPTTPTVQPATPTTTTTGRPTTTTTRPGLPPVPGTTTVRPATPTPGTTVTPGTTPTRPGLPAVPGTTTVRPVTPTPATPATPSGTSPTTTRPGLPPVPGATPVRPATPTPSTPSVSQRPGLPPTTGRPATPPTATPPTGRPTTPTVTAPTVRPATPPTATPQTVRPATPPTVRPATPPTARPATPPTVRPATPPAARPTPPAARPTPPAARPTPPAARPTPPAARPLPPRPSPPPAARPAPPAARPAPPAPRPAAPPPPRQPVCSMVNGKKVCK